MYEYKKNFLEIIDNRLNELEFYFRSKWFEYEGERVAIRKHSKRFSSDLDAHLVVSNLKSKNDILLSFKYTTSVYKTKKTSENEDSMICLKIPRGKAKYKKTWGSVDYIIGEYRTKKSSTVYYFNRVKLFEYLQAREETASCLQVYLESKGISIDDYYSAEDVGIDVDMLEKMGILEHKDILYFENGIYIELLKANTRMEPAYCTNRWKNGREENSTAYWVNFKLRSCTDQSKAIVVFRLDDESINAEFKSITEAAKSIFGDEYTQGKEANIRDVLKGRSKKFKAQDLKFGVKYKS